MLFIAMACRAPARFARPLGSARRCNTRAAISLVLIACLVSSARTITAQEQAQTATPSVIAWPPGVEVQHRSFAADDLVGSARPAQRRSSRDTLKNGAIIGAVVGAAGLGAVAALICNLYQEEGGASCLRDTLRGAAIGAAVGIGAGVAVDAAFTRHAGVTVRIGVTF